MYLGHYFTIYDIDGTGSVYYAQTPYLMQTGDCSLQLD